MEINDNLNTETSPIQTSTTTDPSPVISEISHDQQKKSGSGVNLKSVAPFLLLGLVAVVLAVGMVFALNYAKDPGGMASKSTNKVVNDTDTDKTTDSANNDQDWNTNSRNTVDPEVKSVDDTVGEIDSTIKDLDSDESFSDFDTSELGF